MARRDPIKPAVRRRRPANAPRRWAAIRLFAMDVDGVLTDGSVLIFSDGSEAKRFSILDGLGLARLREAGVGLAWISGRASGATTRRAEELRIAHLIQGRTDKQVALATLAAQLGLDATQVAYMGDDEIDVPAIAWAGIGAAPPGAMPAALAVADWVTVKAAGHGAVREICDQILRHRSRPKEQSARRS
jgi:3-deoxy-D-manno-octulosonate 8-phosphate phosphatase (KDO 8-P phosphatase)